MGLFSSAPATHFPAAAGRTLDGDDIRFPQDLPADATLVIVSFQDDLDPLSDQWARLGDRIGTGLDGRFAVVEAPVVGRAFKLLGDLGTIGIRGQVDSDAERSRTIPLYVDKKVFRKKLSLKTNDVSAFLLARDGRIAWRGEGAIDMDEIADLEVAIGEVLAAPVPPATDHPEVDEAPSAGEAETPDDDPRTADDEPRTADAAQAPDAADTVPTDAEAGAAALPDA